MFYETMKPFRFCFKPVFVIPTGGPVTMTNTYQLISESSVKSRTLNGSYILVQMLRLVGRLLFQIKQIVQHIDERFRFTAFAGGF